MVRFIVGSSDIIQKTYLTALSVLPTCPFGKQSQKHLINLYTCICISIIYIMPLSIMATHLQRYNICLLPL